MSVQKRGLEPKPCTHEHRASDSKQSPRRPATYLLMVMLRQTRTTNNSKGTRKIMNEKPLTEVRETLLAEKGGAKGGGAMKGLKINIIN